MAAWQIAALGASLAVLTGLLAHSYVLARAATRVERWRLHDHPSRRGLAWEDVSFPSSDGVSLRGWYLPAGDGVRCVVMVQGEEHHRDSPAIRALELAGDLVKQRFSVLLFDLRGRGESGGRGSAGTRELEDTLAALAYAAGRGIAPERTALLGFSLGAGLSLCAAAVRPSLGAVVSDSGFCDLLDDYRARHPVAAWLSAWMLIPMVRVMGKMFFGSDPGLVRPLRDAARVRQPVLFIHGMEDTVLPPSESERLYARCGSVAKELWLVPGAGHVECYATQREEYVRRVAGFLAARLG